MTTPRKPKAFGQRLLQARLDLAARRGRAVTQAEIAEAIGVTGVTLGRYERGAKEPSLEMFEKLAAVLGVPASYLAFGVDAAEEQDVPVPRRKPAPTATKRAAGGEGR